MSFPERAALLARLAQVRPHDLARLLAFRETFLVRLPAAGLRIDLRNLGVLFGKLAEESSLPPGTGLRLPGWPAGLRAAGDDLRACEILLEEMAADLSAVAPAGSAYHRRAKALLEITREMGRLAARLEELRPKRARKAARRGEAE